MSNSKSSNGSHHDHEVHVGTGYNEWKMAQETNLSQSRTVAETGEDKNHGRSGGDHPMHEGLIGARRPS
jgi:hypothetical protein